MQTKQRQTEEQRPKFKWMDWVGLATMAVVTFFAFNFYPANDPRRWAVVGLLLLITALQIWPFVGPMELPSKQRFEQGRLVILTLLSLLLFWLDVNYTAVIILYFVFSGRALLLFPNGIGYAWVLFWGLITMIAMAWGLWPNLVYGLLNGLGATCGYFFVGSAANAQRRAEEATAELQATHHQLQAYATRVEELTIAEERNRLAREMHDTLGHRLTVAAVQLEGAEKLITRNPGKARKMVGTVRAQVLEGLNELRQTVAELRTPVEEELPLPTALTRLVTNFVEATSLDVELSLPDVIPDLDAAHRQALYRTAQEALTNIQRHAQATQVIMMLSLLSDSAIADGMIDTQIQLWVEDNGIGIDGNDANDERASFGLQGLSERAQALQGLFRVDQGNMLGGTCVTLRLPLPLPLPLPIEDTGEYTDGSAKMDVNNSTETTHA